MHEKIVCWKYQRKEFDLTFDNNYFSLHYSQVLRKKHYDDSKELLSSRLKGAKETYRSCPLDIRKVDGGMKHPQICMFDNDFDLQKLEFYI